MTILSSPCKPVSRILFTACEKIAPTNPRFGTGILASSPVYHEDRLERDDAFFANELARQCREAGLEPTDPYGVEDLDAMEPDWDALAEESAAMGRMQRGLGAPAAASITPEPACHLLRGDDGTALAVVMNGVNPNDVAACTDRARKVIRDLGPLPRVAWIARSGDVLAIMDRDEFAGNLLVFCGSTPIRPNVLEAAFACRLPR